MAQHAARAEFPTRAGGPPAEGPEELGRDWLIYRDCRLRPSDRGGSPTVLIHPARGIAVLDVLPSNTPDAADALRARLAAARFPAIFAGHLPVVHLRVAPRQMPFLPSLLDDAFAAQPPLRLPGGDAWVGVAARALTAEHPVPRLESRRFSGATDERPHGRRAAAALRKAGAVSVCLAALGGVLGLALRGAPAPVPSSPVAAPAGDGGPREAALPALPPAAPESVPAAAPPPPSPPRGETAAIAPIPEGLSPPALPQPPAEVPPPPPPPPQRTASPPSATRPPEAGSPPNRRAAERTAPRRQQEAGAAPSPAGAAPSSPEAAAERCRRVSALVGSGAPLGDADMRFFNEACIRW